MSLEKDKTITIKILVNKLWICHTKGHITDSILTL
jgi:hypothetical protein